MTFLDPALFELHIVFAARWGESVAFSLRPRTPVLSAEARQFCQFLYEYLCDPLKVGIFAGNDTLTFTAHELTTALQLRLATSYYIDIRRILDADERRNAQCVKDDPLPLGVCRDPLLCPVPETVYVHRQTKSPGPRVQLTFSPR